MVYNNKLDGCPIVNHNTWLSFKFFVYALQERSGGLTLQVFI